MGAGSGRILGLLEVLFGEVALLAATMVRASEQDGEVLVMLSREGGLVRVGEDT